MSDFVAVAVVPAVEAQEVAEVGCRLVGCDGTFPVAGDGGTVVIEGRESPLPEVIEGGGYIRMGEDASLLQVTVGEIPPWVVVGDNACLDIRMERGAPEGRRVVWSKEDASHPWFGSVHRADYRRVVRYHLRESGRTEGDVRGEGLEVSDVIPQEPAYLDPVFVQVGESQLQGTKEARGARDCRSHEPELAQHTLPFLDADSVVAS